MAQKSLLYFGTSCCAVEMMQTGASHHDYYHFYFEVARQLPRQAGLIIIAETMVNKMAPVLRRLYGQMVEPKYIIAMESVLFLKVFFYNIYSVVKGANYVISFDVYVPDCSPRPETL